MINKTKTTINKGIPVKLQSRRYIGNKFKLANWIFSIIDSECRGDIFADIFAGTGIISAEADGRYKKIILNDLLFSNNAVYNAFFSKDKWGKKKLNKIINEYNALDPKDLKDNYFSINFGGNFFSKNSAKIIGEIRNDIEKRRNALTKREYYILIASLLYSVDKVANTVGHYEAYFKNKNYVKQPFYMRIIEPISTNSVEIYREDANVLAKNLSADIVYIDPPYNSRQYSRFYHVLENLTKWEKPQLFGVALKPKPENMSDYCRSSAKYKFKELINDLNVKFIVVSYNNTYNSKSSSSENKISHDELKSILSKKGRTKVFEKQYKHFNSGKTNFADHKEYLFVTHVKQK